MDQLCISSGRGGWSTPFLPDYECIRILDYVVPDLTSLSIKEEVSEILKSKPCCVTTIKDAKLTDPKIPLWKRRGVKQIATLTLDPMICCDAWMEKFEMMEPLLEIVHNKEWVTRGDHFEAHSIEDIHEGVVINPPVFPGWYAVQSTGRVIPAQLPYCTDYLIERARKFGYDMKNLIRTMGVMVSDYSIALTNPRKRVSQEILILAGKEWQGAAAIFAAFRLKLMKMNVSVYIHEAQVRGEEELSFINAGGTVYRNLKDLQGRKFRVVVVALENQHSRRSTILPLFGDLLQHSVAVFVDPPVLKGSYSNALQYACRGTYNISQKTVIFVPNLPKTYVKDNFVDVFVVDVGIIPELHMACGMEPFNFRQKANHNSTAHLVVPQKFNEKGSKIYFYNTEGAQVP